MDRFTDRRRARLDEPVPGLFATAYTDPVPSPDGAMLAWISDRHGRPRAWVAPLPPDGSPVATALAAIAADSSRSFAQRAEEAGSVHLISGSEGAVVAADVFAEPSSSLPHAAVSSESAPIAVARMIPPASAKRTAQISGHPHSRRAIVAT